MAQVDQILCQIPRQICNSDHPIHPVQPNLIDNERRPNQTASPNDSSRPIEVPSFTAEFCLKSALKRLKSVHDFSILCNSKKYD